ncbi:heparan-alpha-glucosaminide N-acetyltransferase domain-containing protein [Neptunitalea lumnitzerae]|nr:heparan-alpha-glucosaminide N-acetyltransferase domain-containing protein [Neptunitalea sp. Y10]
MKPSSFRLYFIDLIRAFAICMMLQGHFTDSLLGHEFRDPNNIFYSVWLYFRGITAPTFFTVSGFIFTYLLIKDTVHTGWNNIRVSKGIRRGITLVLVGYALRTNMAGLLMGRIYDGFYMVDVLQCIGISLMLIITVYLLTLKAPKWVMPLMLLSATVFLFAFEPIYSKLSFDYLPKMFANYFTKANGSVFTIFPWFGYAAFGSFMGYVFNYFKERKNMYSYAVVITLITGLALLFGSSPFFNKMYEWTNISLFHNIYSNNYLFARLGNVLLSFAIFMILQNVITSRKIREIGQNTLSIYIIHFMLLYGSFTGLGLYKYFNHQLHPYIVVPGAILFVITNVFISFKYNLYKPDFDEKVAIAKQEVMLWIIGGYYLLINLGIKIKQKVDSLLSTYRNS